MTLQVGDEVYRTASMGQCMGIWPHDNADGIITSIEPWNDAWLVHIDWGDGPIPIRCETLEEASPCEVDEPEPGFSPEYGNWQGCHRSKSRQFKKDCSRRGGWPIKIPE